MFNSIKSSLFDSLLNNVTEIEYQRNVDYMSAACIVLSNVVRGDFEQLGLSSLEVRDRFIFLFDNFSYFILLFKSSRKIYPYLKFKIQSSKSLLFDQF